MKERTLGMCKEHILAMVRDGDNVSLRLLRVVPMNRYHIGPLLPLCDFHQLPSYFRGGVNGAPPENLLLFVHEFQVFLHLVDSFRNLPHGAHVSFWPGPEAKIGHQPDGVVFGLAGIGPHWSVAADFVDPLRGVVHGHCEFDVG